MATLQQVIQLVFEGVDNASETTRNVTASLQEFADAGEAIVQPIADATSAILRFEAGLVLTGAAIIGISINAADRFDIAFREIATLTGQTSEALAEFRQDILDYASSSTQSIEQVTQAIYAAISGGVDYTDSLEIVTAAERLAVASKAQLGETLTGLVSTLNAYGETTDQAGRYSDVFFTIVRLGQTTLPELTSSLSRVTTTAVSGRVPFETLGAAVATLTAAGAPTSEAITRINAALAAILNPTAQARDLAEQLGIQFNAQALQSRGLQAVMQDVARATGGSAEQMFRLFGSTDAFNAVNILAITGADRFRNNLDAMRNAAGATSTAFNTMKDATDTLAQAFTVLGITLGDQFLAEFNSIEDALAELANAFSTAINQDSFDPLIDIVEENMGRIAELFSDIARNLPAALEDIDFVPFANALRELFNTISEIFNFEDLGTEEGLQRALQTLVDFLTRTTEYANSAVRSFGPFVEKLGETIEWISQIDIDKIRSIGEFGGYALVASTAFGALSLTLSGLVGAAGALPRLVPLITTLTTEFSLLSAAIASGATTAILGVVGAVGTLAFTLTLNSGLADKLNDILIPDATSYEGATLGSLIADLAEKLGFLGGTVDSTVPKMQRLPDAFSEQTTAARETRVEINSWMDAQEAAARQTADTSAEISRLTSYYKELGYAYDANTGALTKLNDAQNETSRNVYALSENIKITGDAFSEASNKTGNYSTALDGISTKYEQVGTRTVRATGAFKAVADSASEQAVKVDEATKKADDYLTKMEEIASNERIKTIEAIVDFKIANVQADAKRVEAAFESIDVVVKSTGDLIGSLFESLIGTEDIFKASFIRDQIEKENKRRQEALDIQKKLLEAEIARIEAQTRALERGDALIRIDGAGLAPQLEAFMWEILKAIRVRANAEFADYLLGLGATA